MFLAFLVLIAAIIAGIPPIAHGLESYKVQAFPFYSQEGSTITLILTVGSANTSTTYEFDFIVQDPANANCTSTVPHTTGSTETEFPIIASFPGAQFSTSCAPTSLVGTYRVYVDEIKPVFKRNVDPERVVFYIGLVDSRFSLFSLLPYERTQTVHIQAVGYRPGESVIAGIRTTSSLTVVFTNSTVASSSGIVTSAWKIPRNATVTEGYLVTILSTLTNKNRSDAQGFFVQAAPVTIPTLTSSRSTYQRTETFSFSFQSRYPDGSTANTGAALITLVRPDGANITLTANYDSASQNFVARYRTSATNQTGTWRAILAPNGYDDGNGNTGPGTSISTSPQLQPATLSVSIVSQSSYTLNQQIRFNATIQYPDGVNLQSGSVSSFLAFSGGSYNDTVPILFDSTLQLWVGSYAPGYNEPGGLWSLTVFASDAATPSNSGFAARVITLQDRPPTASFTESAITALPGVTINFNGTASSDPDGTIVSYSWDYGDGSTGRGLLASHSYSTPGSYTIKLTVTDNSGTTASSTSVISVQASPSPSGGNDTLPLFYFGTLAAIIAAMLGGGFAYFRRHKATHTNLKIDLEAVKSEAGRIENNEFFQSVKEQLRKEKDD